MKNLQSGYRRILLYIFVETVVACRPVGHALLFFFQGTTYSIKAIFYGNCVRRTACHTPVRTKCEAGMR